MKVMYFPALLLALLLPLTGHAQLSGQNTKGDFGLLAGTQAPPGFYIVSLFYDYTADFRRVLIRMTANLNYVNSA